MKSVGLIFSTMTAVKKMNGLTLFIQSFMIQTV